MRMSSSGTLTARFLAIGPAGHTVEVFVWQQANLIIVLQDARSIFFQRQLLALASAAIEAGISVNLKVQQQRAVN